MHTTGATDLRVRITGTDGDATTLELAEVTGRPVASVRALTLRAVPADRLTADAGGRLHVLEWPVVASPAGDGPSWVEITDEPGVARNAPYAVVRLGGGDPGPQEPYATTARALRLVQDWLADPALLDARLAVVTRHAVSTGPGEGVGDLDAAPVWGCCAPRRPNIPAGSSWSTSTTGATACWVPRSRPGSRRSRCGPGSCGCPG